MSGGWTVVDANTNKSMPIQGTAASGSVTPYITPSPGSQDPVGKMRVSTPQSLIDTDFEYGTQPTKWESIGLQNNRQSVYYFGQAPLAAVTAVSGTATADRVTVSFTGTVAANTPIFIQNTNNSTINGWGYTVAGGTNSMTVQLAPGSSTTVDATNYFNPTATYVYPGYFYSNCGIQVAAGTTAVVVTSASLITVTTVNPHGLSKGSYVYIVGTTGGTNVNGPGVVVSVPTANTFTITAASASGTVTTTAGVINIFARPSGFVEPRTFDGGVAFSAGGAVPNQQLIRQTRRYFRYQSGKGIQFSTGTSVKPSLFVTSLTASSTTITVTSRFQHNLAAGCVIQVIGADQGSYNGTFTVATVPTPTTLTYTAKTAPVVTTATGNAIRVSPLNWYGSSNRLGMFDQQNGMFFEFDGQTLYAVLRNSINQLSGTVAVTQGSSAITGTGTQFTTQLQPNDYIVMRGQSYKILTIASDTSMYVSPEYRGATLASGVLISKTIDTKIPQSQWQDPCNGTGPSGYNLDLTRMQMWFMDYSWYGAGVIRYGFRGTNGNITYVTQIQNNNKQFEAYMRSGNMASHYESNGQGVSTILQSSLGNTNSTLPSAITSTDITITLASATNYNPLGGVVKIDSELIFYSSTSGNNLINCIRGFGGTAAAAHASSTSVQISSIDIADTTAFAPSGTVKVTAAGQTGAIEYIAYTGNTGGILYGLTRAQAGGDTTAGGLAFTYSVTAPVIVEYAAPDTVASLSHWGSSVIMDGQFNDDKSLIFNFGTVTQLAVAAGATVPVLAIRIAPSVDNGVIGTLGQREIINRMQLQLQELGVLTTQPFLIQMVLNGYTTGTSTWGVFQSPTQNNTLTSSLSQVSAQTNTLAGFTGGESVAAAFTNTSGQTTLDLSQVRDLGNAILGGGTSNSVPVSQAGQYPDGPDVLYVVATNTSGSSGNILARLSWKEAQA